MHMLVCPIVTSQKLRDKISAEVLQSRRRGLKLSRRGAELFLPDHLPPQKHTHTYFCLGGTAKLEETPT